MRSRMRDKEEWHTGREYESMKQTGRMRESTKRWGKKDKNLRSESGVGEQGLSTSSLLAIAASCQPSGTQRLRKDKEKGNVGRKEKGKGGRREEIGQLAQQKAVGHNP